MAKSRYPFLEKLANGKNVLLLLGLFLAFTTFIMPALEADIKALSGGVGVLDLKFLYSPETTLSMLHAYGTEGIRLYLIAEWTADLIFPMIGGLLFATLLVWVGAKRWFWLGPLMMVTDWTENVFITMLLIQYPDFHPGIAMVCSSLTTIKWSLLMVMVVMVLFQGGKKLLARYSYSGAD